MKRSRHCHNRAGVAPYCLYDPDSTCCGLALQESNRFLDDGGRAASGSPGRKHERSHADGSNHVTLGACRDGFSGQIARTTTTTGQSSPIPVMAYAGVAPSGVAAIPTAAHRLFTPPSGSTGRSPSATRAAGPLDRPVDGTRSRAPGATITVYRSSYTISRYALPGRIPDTDIDRQPHGSAESHTAGVLAVSPTRSRVRARTPPPRSTRPVPELGEGGAVTPLPRGEGETVLPRWEPTRRFTRISVHRSNEDVPP